MKKRGKVRKKEEIREKVWKLKKKKKYFLFNLTNYD